METVVGPLNGCRLTKDCRIQVVGGVSRLLNDVKSLAYNRFLGMCPVLLITGSRRCHHAGGPDPLLLPERAVPRLRQTRAGQPDGLWPLRQAPAHPTPVLPVLQGPVLRAE